MIHRRSSLQRQFLRTFTKIDRRDKDRQLLQRVSTQLSPLPPDLQEIGSNHTVIYSLHKIFTIETSTLGHRTARRIRISIWCWSQIGHAVCVQKGSYLITGN